MLILGGKLLLLTYLLHLIGVGHLCSEFGADHTMCLKKKKCNLEIGSPITDGQIKKIVDKHNLLRQSVAKGHSKQPRASNMNKLKWSKELAEIAQAWANYCETVHDRNRRTAKYPYVGQNIYFESLGPNAPDLDFEHIIDLWFKEIDHFDPNKIDPYIVQKAPEASHYTQLIWATTKEVGCGYSVFKDSNLFTLFFVCNYGPGGNEEGYNKKIYKMGDPCADCPGFCSKKFDGLCDREANITNVATIGATLPSQQKTKMELLCFVIGFHFLMTILCESNI